MRLDCPGLGGTIKFQPVQDKNMQNYPGLVGTLKFPPVQDNFKFLSWTGWNFKVPASPGQYHPGLYDLYNVYNKLYTN